jgi:hypothetical protein
VISQLLCQYVVKSLETLVQHFHEQGCCHIGQRKLVVLDLRAGQGCYINVSQTFGAITQQQGWISTHRGGAYSSAIKNIQTRLKSSLTCDNSTSS